MSCSFRQICIFEIKYFHLRRQDTGKFYKKGQIYQKLKIKDLYFHFVLWYITKKFYKDIYLQFLESCTIFTSNYCFCIFLHRFLHRNSYNLSTSLYDKANVVAPINLNWYIYSRINYIWLHTNDIWMTCEYMRLLYWWNTSTYQWHTSTYEWCTDNIWMMYEYIRVAYEWHTSNILMAYEFIQVTYGWHASDISFHVDDIQMA